MPPCASASSAGVPLRRSTRPPSRHPSRPGPKGECSHRRTPHRGTPCRSSPGSAHQADPSRARRRSTPGPRSAGTRWTWPTSRSFLPSGRRSPPPRRCPSHPGRLGATSFPSTPAWIVRTPMRRLGRMSPACGDLRAPDVPAQVARTGPVRGWVPGSNRWGRDHGRLGYACGGTIRVPVPYRLLPSCDPEGAREGDSRSRRTARQA